MKEPRNQYKIMECKTEQNEEKNKRKQSEKPKFEKVEDFKGQIISMYTKRV